MDPGLRNYLIVTGGYWTFTLTDGAIRMLVVLYFHLKGYSPLEVAMLFLFYEFFGIVTNLVGGWLGARLGLNLIMHIGMSMQVIALAMLTVPDAWLSVGYVMAAQALSGIAKDLNKMSAKASVKALAGNASDSSLFKWVAVLTGSKNALKGLGFFLGALLLQWAGFRGALAALASLLSIVLVATAIVLPSGVGKMNSKPKFRHIFSNRPAINWLAAARFFLFASRDVWFVVGLPVFLYSTLGWEFVQVGGFLAFWVIGYGIVQASTPTLLRRCHYGGGPGGGTARRWGFALALVPGAIAYGLQQGVDPAMAVTGGLLVFGVLFAINSAVHSYLILAYSEMARVSMDVGFYYMANAGGRLFGTVLSGWAYQAHGLAGCLWWSAGMLAVTVFMSCPLPEIAGTSQGGSAAVTPGGVKK